MSKKVSYFDFFKQNSIAWTKLLFAVKKVFGLCPSNKNLNKYPELHILCCLLFGIFYLQYRNGIHVEVKNPRGKSKYFTRYTFWTQNQLKQHQTPHELSRPSKGVRQER